MATLNIPKRIDEIQEPELMPEGMYPFRVAEEPERAENNALKNGGETAEGAGYNLVIQLMCISEDPRFYGKRLTKYLPFPVDGDDDKWYDGQNKTNEKLSNMVKTSKAFGHEPEGDSIIIDQGDEAMFYVVVQEHWKEAGKMVNALCMNTLPKPIS